jgi:phage terminase large subunit GpA-like protein
MNRADLIAIGREAMTPPDNADPVAWLARNITRVPAGAFAGGYNPKRWPWIAESLRLFLDPSTRTMVDLWSIQTGKTLKARLAATYLMANDRGNMVIYMDNQVNAADFTIRYLRPMFNLVDDVRKHISPNDNAKGDIIDFADGTIVYNNSATTEKDLQRISTRYVIGDEIWLWKKGAVAQSMARTKAYEWTAKKLYLSQAGIVGGDLDNIWMMTTRHEWNFVCPHEDCRKLQPWDWSYVRFPEQAKTPAGWDHLMVEQNTTYECAGCKRRLHDTNETRIECNAVENGAQFVQTAQPQKSGWVGTHVNALASTSWGSLAVDMLKAKEASEVYGDEENRKIFKMKYLAIPWSDDGGSMVVSSESADYAMEDEWEGEAVITPAGKVVDKEGAPDGSIPFRVCGIDVQRGFFYAVVRRFAKTGHSRLKAFAKVETWQDLDAFVKAHGCHKALCLVDSGDQTQEVYRQTALRGWKCSKGSGQESFSVGDRDGNTVRRFYSEKQAVMVPGVPQRAWLISFAATPAKDLLHGLRSRKVWGFARDASPEYVEQLNAEVRVKDRRTGKATWLMPQGKKDNHALDCEILALLVAVRWGVVGREATADDLQKDGGESQ